MKVIAVMTLMLAVASTEIQGGKGSQKYGLIVPKKGPLQPRLNIFQDEDDDNEKDKTTEKVDWVKKTLENSSKSRVSRDALKQDSSVYEYDEVYDDIQQQKGAAHKKKTEDHKPRYIQALMKQADRRKLEEERRVERKVQKEREAEGSEFKDKESFVTASYRKKVEEFSKLDAEDLRQEKLDELMDVTKRKDMSLFYKNLYDNITDATASNKIEDKEPEQENAKTKKSSRQYRKRRRSPSSDEESDKELVNRVVEHKEPSPVANTAEDKDSSSDSSSSSGSGSENETDMSASELEEGEIPEPKQREKKSEHSTGNRRKSSDAEKRASTEVKKNDDTDVKKKDSIADVQVKETEIKQTVVRTETSPENSQQNIWEKRTVGQVFEAALKRYFLRKSTKSVYLSV